MKQIKFKKQELPSIEELMINQSKSREEILEQLGITVPKRKLIIFDRNTRDEIKKAKQSYKKALKEGTLVVSDLAHAFVNRTPQWGAIKIYGMLFPAL